MTIPRFCQIVFVLVASLKSLLRKLVNQMCCVFTTVKLGYITFTVIANSRLHRTKFTDIFGHIWLIYNINIHGYNDVPDIANKYRRSRKVRYNRVRLYWNNYFCVQPKPFYTNTNYGSANCVLLQTNNSVTYAYLLYDKPLF